MALYPLKKLLTLLGLMLALALPLPAAAQEPETDQALLARLLSDLLSDAGREVQIFGFTGALTSQATISEIRISDVDGVWLTIHGVVLDWSRSALFQRRLEVNALTAERIVLTRPPDTGPSAPSPEAREFTLPELPLTINIGEVSVQSVILGEAILGEQAEVRLQGRAQLAGGAGSANFAINRIDGPQGRLTLAGSYSNTSRLLTLDMSVTEEANGIAVNLLGLPDSPALDLSIAGVGRVDEFVANVRLATDGVDRLSGQVQLVGEPPEPTRPQGTRRFTADIGGDIAPLFAPDFQAFFGDGVRLQAAGASLPDGSLELSQLDLQSNALRLSGRVLVGPDWLPREIFLSGDIADPDGESVLLPLGGARTLIDNAQLRLGFDAAVSEDWDASITLNGLERDDLRIGQLMLVGSGQITGNGVQAGFSADLNFAATGIAPDDPALARAIGQAVTGRTVLEWQQGMPIELLELRLTGDEFGIEGQGRIIGQRIEGSVDARLDNAARVSDIAGRPLGGSVAGRVEGYYELLTGAAQIAAQLTGQDLTADIEELDRLLAGTSSIRAELRRDTEGTFLDTLEVNAQELTAMMTGRISSVSAALDADLEFADLSVMGDQYRGALNAVGHFSSVDGIQRFTFTATGVDLGVGQTELDRLLLGESQLAVEATQRDGVFNVEVLTLRASTLSANVAGRIGSGMTDISGRLEFSDLSTLGNGYGGALFGQGRFFDYNGGQMVTFTATGEDLSIGQPNVDRLLMGQSTLMIEGALHGDTLNLNRFAINAGALTAQASGVLRLGASEIEAELEFADLGALQPGLGGRIEASATLREEGEARHFTLSATGQDLSVGQPDVDRLLAGETRLSASGIQQGDAITLEALILDAGALGARASGVLRLGASDIEADLVFADLGVLQPGFGGRVEASATLREVGDARHFTLVATGQDLSIGQADVDRLLAGETRLSASGVQQGDAITLDAFSLNAGDIGARASGVLRLGASVIEAELEFADLAALEFGIAGRLEASATLREEDAVWHVTLAATGQNLSIGQPDVDRLLAGQSLLTASGTLRGDAIDLEGLTLNTAALSARASGLLRAGESAITFDAELADLAVLDLGIGGRLQASGSLREEGETRHFSIEAIGTNLRSGIPQIDPVLQGEMRFIAEGSQSSDRLQLDRLELRSPQITADATALFDEEDQQLDFTARLNNLAALVPELPGAVTVAGQVTDAPGGAYQFSMTGTGPGGINASVNGLINPDLTLDLTATGTTNLAVTNPFHEPINNQGIASFDLRIIGPPALESISGTVSTSNARIVVPQFGVALEAVAATATLGNGQVALDASTSVQGGGTAQLRGTIGLQMGLFPADLEVVLDQVFLTDRRMLETRVSGQLAITGGLVQRQGQISGALSLVDTEIRLPSTGLGTGAYIPNLIHVNETPATRATRFAARLPDSGVDANGQLRNFFTLNITVSSPNRVFVRGRGLDAELGGTLLLTGTTLNVVPSGEFTLIRGRLDILGRRFVLSEGLARLQGQFIPYLELTATTSTDGIMASITLQGEADALSISFTSSPDLPEEEVVARLLFGHGLTRLSPFQAAQLASAVATLAGRGGEGITGNLRQTFGLDDLDISTGTTGVAALRLGRYLTENIYTDITIDATGRSEVSINLDVSPSVTVRARTDTEGRSGVGVFFERDF